MTGIEDFISLEYIEIWNSNLTSIDLSNNILLDSIKIINNSSLLNINTSNLSNLKIYIVISMH